MRLENERAAVIDSAHCFTIVDAGWRPPILPQATGRIGIGGKPDEL